MAGAKCGGGEALAHLAAAAVAEVADGVDRLAGGAGGEKDSHGGIVMDRRGIVVLVCLMAVIDG